MQIRLKERCFIGGRIREVGEIVTLAEGERGPTRAIRKNTDKIDYGTDPPIDANRRLGEVFDVPLFEVVSDKEIPRDVDQQRAAETAARQRENAVASRAIQQSKEGHQNLAVQSQPPGEVRTLTHVEERDNW